MSVHRIEPESGGTGIGAPEPAERPMGKLPTDDKPWLVRTPPLTLKKKKKNQDYSPSGDRRDSRGVVLLGASRVLSDCREST